MRDEITEEPRMADCPSLLDTTSLAEYVEIKLRNLNIRKTPFINNLSGKGACKLQSIVSGKGLSAEDLGDFMHELEAVSDLPEEEKEHIIKLNENCAKTYKPHVQLTNPEDDEKTQHERDKAKAKAKAKAEFMIAPSPTPLCGRTGNKPSHRDMVLRVDSPKLSKHMTGTDQQKWLERLEAKREEMRNDTNNRPSDSPDMFL